MSKFQPKLVAVYGTLRRGQGNNALLGNSKMVGTGLLRETGTMFSNGGFPILSFNEETFSDKNEKVLVEVFEVADAGVMDRLDRLEGYPRWYNRTLHNFDMADGSTVTAWIYHQDENFLGRLPVVESGDWVKFSQNQYRNWQRAAE